MFSIKSFIKYFYFPSIDFFLTQKHSSHLKKAEIKNLFNLKNSMNKNWSNFKHFSPLKLLNCTKRTSTMRNWLNIEQKNFLNGIFHFLQLHWSRARGGKFKLCQRLWKRDGKGRIFHDFLNHTFYNFSSLRTKVSRVRYCNFLLIQTVWCVKVFIEIERKNIWLWY